MGLIEELRALGADVDEGLERVMGDSSLYEMMLGMFVDSVRDNPVGLADFDGGDLETVIKRVHLLKGVTGNLALTPLFERYTQVLGLLRNGQTAQAKEGFAGILPLQEKMLDCIRQHKGA